MEKEFNHARCGVLLGDGCGVRLEKITGTYICDEERGGRIVEKYKLKQTHICQNCGKMSEYIWVSYKLDNHFVRKTENIKRE